MKKLIARLQWDLTMVEGTEGSKHCERPQGAGLAGPGCGVRVETAAAAAATEESIRERKSRRGWWMDLGEISIRKKSMVMNLLGSSDQISSYNNRSSIL